MIRNRQIFIPLFMLTLGSLGCGLFSSKTGDAEMVFAVTEVGTPEGDKVTKDIGPGGGTLASPDGRMTLTVPQNALTETIAFSMQPITNKAGGGLGLAYRLEPNGKTFTTPLEIAVRYDEQDLEGTVPEALSIAYQDGQGAWHLLNVAKLDQSAKTLTVSTTHFTDWSFLTKLRLRPKKATLRVGERLNIEILGCEPDNWLDRLIKSSGGIRTCKVSDNELHTWSLPGNWYADIGTIDNPRALSVLYTAPPKKPTPNVATVSFPYDFQYAGEGGKSHRGMFTSKITIVDRGYRVTGQARDSVLSGVVCDLEKPFDVSATHPLANYVIKFVPSTPGAGTASYALSYPMVTESGKGTYTLASGGDGFDIIFNFSSTANALGRSVSGKGTANIHLAPLESNEGGCGE
jgi:hypothetical protein